jgi:hypothetical protein
MFGPEIHCQSPFNGLEVLYGGGRNEALGLRHSFLQSPGCLALVGFVLGTNPSGVFVARTDFVERTKMTFRCALEEGFKERGSDFHGWSILPKFSLRIPHPDSRTRLSALLSWPRASRIESKESSVC